MSTGSITKRGKSSYRIKYDIGRDPETGKRNIVYATVRGSKADAQKELRRRLTALDKGMHVDPSAITIADYLDGWLKDVASESVAPKALERYAGIIRNQIKPHLGQKQIQKLRPADVSAWMKKLGQTDISVRSVRHAHGVLRVAFNHAAAIELVERNVVSLIKPPRAEKNKPEIIAEGVKVLDKLAGHSIYTIAALALGTGARRGEIAGLVWGDIDFDAEMLRIERSIEETKDGLRVKAPKTQAGYRTISLPAFAVTALRDHKRETLELRLKLGMGNLTEDTPVFADLEGNWQKPYIITDRWRNAVKGRKLPKVTFHALRHTHASALIAAGLDPVSISRRLGHASPALTLSTYAHLFVNKDDEAAAAVDAAFS